MTFGRWIRRPARKLEGVSWVRSASSCRCLLRAFDALECGPYKAYMEEYPGYYQTGDAGYIDEDGYIFVMTRTDDIINVAGHRLSTGAMEEVLADHPDVAECAVIGVADQLKGQVPLGFLVLSAGVKRAHEEIVGEVVKLVRERFGPVAAFKSARSSAGCRRRARKNPARDDAEDRGQRRLQNAGDDRRPGHPGRDFRCPEDRVREVVLRSLSKLSVERAERCSV